MTGVAQSPRAAADSGRDEAIATTQQLIPPTAPVSREARRLSWRTVGWFACGVAGSVAVIWFIVFSPGAVGPKAQWFFGAVVLCVAMVSMWQVAAIQRMARRQAAAAAQRHREELAAAEDRAMRELTMTQRLHRTQMEAQQRMHHAEVEAQRELARIERDHLVNQLQQQAVIEVARAVNAHTQTLAALWRDAAGILALEDRDERELAMKPVFERTAQVVNDFALEIANAHLLVEDDRVHRALDHVNEAALLAIRVAEDVHEAVVDGVAPDPDAFPATRRLMQTRAAEARQLAWQLVRAGLDNSRATTGLE